MARKPAFKAWYTRFAVWSFFHAVPYTNLGTVVSGLVFDFRGAVKAGCVAIFRTCSLADSVLLQRDVKKARRTPTAINRLPQFRSTVPSLDYKAECHYLMRANYLMIFVLIDEVEGSMGRETTSHHSGSMSRRGTVTPPRLKKLRCLRM